MGNARELISNSKNQLLLITKGREIINWAVKNEINQELSLVEFKEELQKNGIDFKTLKRCQDQAQLYNGEISEIRIRGVSKNLVNQLSNISKNLSTDISNILKPKIRELVDNYPSHLKVKREN